MYRSQAELFLQNLGQAMNDPKLALGAKGSCFTQLDGVPFGFFWQDEPPVLFVQARLGLLRDVPEPTTALKDLLKKNHLWQGTAGGIFGLNSEDETFYLSYRLDFPLCDEDPPQQLLTELLPYLLGALVVAQDELFTQPHKTTELPLNAAALRA